MVSAGNKATRLSSVKHTTKQFIIIIIKLDYIIYFFNWIKNIPLLKSLFISFLNLFFSLIEFKKIH